MWGFGVALQAHIPLHQICQKGCFWIPTMGVFEMRNAKKHGVLAWRLKPAYLCTKYDRQSVFGYLGWGCLKCAMPKNVGVWRGGSSPHTSAPNLPAKVFLDTQYGDVCIAQCKKRGGLLAWRSKRAYLCTKYAHQSVFGYLVQGCWHCEIHKKMGVWRGAPSAPTSAPHLPAKAFLDT